MIFGLASKSHNGSHKQEQGQGQGQGKQHPLTHHAG
jgi:hypothetical protein